MPQKRKKNGDVAEFERFMEKRHRGVLLTKYELKRVLMFLDNLVYYPYFRCARCREPAILNAKLCVKHLKENLEYMLSLE